MKTYAELVAEAVAHETAGRWEKAARAWASARAAAPPATVADRAADNGLEPGTMLEHKNRRGFARGPVLATCMYVRPGAWLYAGVVYESPSGAAAAAAKDLGRRRGEVNGWRFWGIEGKVCRKDEARDEVARLRTAILGIRSSTKDTEVIARCDRALACARKDVH